MPFDLDPGFDDPDPKESKMMSDKTVERFNAYLKEAGFPKLTKAMKKKIENAALFGAESPMPANRAFTVSMIALKISGLSSKPRKATLRALVSKLKQA